MVGERVVKSAKEGEQERAYLLVSVCRLNGISIATGSLLLYTPSPFPLIHIINFLIISKTRKKTIRNQYSPINSQPVSQQNLWCQRQQVTLVFEWEPYCSCLPSSFISEYLTLILSIPLISSLPLSFSLYHLYCSQAQKCLNAMSISTDCLSEHDIFKHRMSTSVECLQAQNVCKKYLWVQGGHGDCCTITLFDPLC